MVTRALRDDGTFGKPMPRDLEANGLRKEGETAGCVPVSRCMPRRQWSVYPVVTRPWSSQIARPAAQETALSLWCWRWGFGGPVERKK